MTIEIRYAVIPIRRRIPSRRLSTPFASMMHKIKVIRILSGRSRFKMSLLVEKAAIKAHMPTTTSPLKMLDPMTLLRAISLLPLSAALMLTEASGALVPMATIVSPMITLGTRRSRAREELPSTKKSAPLIRSTKPTTNHTYSIIWSFPR